MTRKEAWQYAFMNAAGLEPKEETNTKTMVICSGKYGNAIILFRYPIWARKGVAKQRPEGVSPGILRGDWRRV
jgi:hypothetical protein